MYVYQRVHNPYATHGAGILTYTKLGDELFGQMLGFIFQHHGSHMGKMIAKLVYTAYN